MVSYLEEPFHTTHTHTLSHHMKPDNYLLKHLAVVQCNHSQSYRPLRGVKDVCYRRFKVNKRTNRRIFCKILLGF